MDKNNRVKINISSNDLIDLYGDRNFDNPKHKQWRTHKIGFESVCDNLNSNHGKIKTNTTSIPCSSSKTTTDVENFIKENGNGWSKCCSGIMNSKNNKYKTLKDICNKHINEKNKEHITLRCNFQK